MKIAIDTTPLETGHKDRGVGRYTKLLIEALQKYEGKHSYYLFTRGQKVPNNAELIHYPYFDPYFITLPFFYSQPTIVTVHDLIPLVFPAHFPGGLRGTLRWQYQRMRLSRSSRIIADSEASKQDIIRIVRFDSERIDVIPLAPAATFGKIVDQRKTSEVMKQYHLPQRFMLYVGDVNWNKNVVGMLKAFECVKCQVSSVKLVLVGQGFLGGSVETREINRYITAHQLDDVVIRLGGVSSEDLAILYSLASVYFQPSFYEGFGLPVLEAMACRAPVVSSSTASLAEIAGPAMNVDPNSPEDMARGILTVLAMTPGKRRQLIDAQTKWVQQFTWERVAHETIKSYEKALQ